MDTRIGPSGRERVAAIGRWLDRAVGMEHPVDRFLALWMALALAAKRRSTSTRPEKRIEDMLKVHKRAVVAVLDRHRASEVHLANEPPPPGEGDGSKMSLLERAWWETRYGPETPERRVRRLAKLLRQAENELLRQGEPAPDAERLRLLTPILAQILENCERGDGPEPSEARFGDDDEEPAN